MKDKETVETMTAGLDLLFSQARLISMLPLGEWIEAFEHAETLGTILDPTLFREYLNSENPEIIKSIILAAIPLKRAVLVAQASLSQMHGEK